MQQNISMQQLKKQRATPAEKFVLDTIKGAKADEPDEDGNVEWFGKDGNWLFEQDFRGGCFWMSWDYIRSALEERYGLSYGETKQLLTKLLNKYTNNGQLKIQI